MCIVGDALAVGPLYRSRRVISGAKAKENSEVVRNEGVRLCCRRTTLVWGYVAWFSGWAVRQAYQRAALALERARTAPSAPEPDDESQFDDAEFISLEEVGSQTSPSEVSISMEEIELERVGESIVEEAPAEGAAARTWWDMILQWWMAILIVLFLLVILLSG